jgi:hypothetical protein
VRASEDDYVATKAGLTPVPAKLDTVIRALSELRACAGLGSIAEKPQPKKRVLQVIMVNE